MFWIDLWQTFGTSQFAELTALAALALSLRPSPPLQKKSFFIRFLG